jgi:hypothetical protein
LLCGLGTLLTGCGRQVPAGASDEVAESPWFADVAAERGLTFVHDPGPTGAYPMPQIMGSGAALFDFDNDGRLDIYLIQNAGPNSRSVNRLFHQRPDGHFEDVTAGSGLDVAGYGMGVAVGDVNNDGWPDVCLTGYGGTRLFLNNGGNGTFTEVTREAGFDSPLWGSSAAFVDYDRDGWLDLVVVNYVDYDPSVRCTNAAGRADYCFPSTFPGTVTKLFRNRGPQVGGRPGAVRFEDVTLQSGIGRLPGPGLGVLCADFNGDGWPDIFVANDSQANRLWINQRNGTFKDEAVVRGVAFNGLGQPQANMGVAWGDVDGDGLYDLFVTHLTDEAPALWRQGPRGLFQDRTAAANLATSRWRGTGFGTVLADFDHDGALDLAVVNGRVAQRNEGTQPPGRPTWGPYAERNQLFVNDGTGRFRDVSPRETALCGPPGVYRGLACGDIDNDGALDLLVTEVGGPVRLFRNVAPQRGHWLLVRAVDPTLRRDAYGAEVLVRAGGHCWRRQINPGSSYQCSNDPRAHFGLGPAEQVEAIEVIWPDGVQESFPGRAADQIIVLRKGDGSKK